MSQLKDNKTLAEVQQALTSGDLSVLAKGPAEEAIATLAIRSRQQVDELAAEIDAIKSRVEQLRRMGAAAEGAMIHAAEMLAEMIDQRACEAPNEPG